MSLEYSMFRFSDDYPTAETLSEMVMQVCMDEDRADNDSTQRLIRALVRATNELRYQEAIEAADELEDDDEVCVRQVENPGERFMDRYARECKKIGEPCNEGDAWWEDWWPTDCPWHPDDVARLARLKAGEARAFRRAMREELAQHKEAADA